jgi:hypothetical protein
VATRPDEEVRGLIHEVAARLMRNAADAGQQERLKRRLRDWYPDTNAVDEMELRRIATLVQQGLHGMAALIEQRKERLIVKGEAAEVPLKVGS